MSLKVYLTFRDKYMTEGYGPMVPDLAFTTREVANNYIDQQPGLMGSREQWSKKKYGGVWEVREIEVLVLCPDIAAKEKEAALAKLTNHEKALLGLT